MRYITSRGRHVAFLRSAPRDDALCTAGCGEGLAAAPPILHLFLSTQRPSSRGAVVYVGDAAICSCFAVRCFT